MSHGAGKGGKRRGGGHEEEHENHERWAVSYADMMTVLMALFLVLFAMSTIDQKKFEELRTSLAKGFGNEALPTDGGSGIEDGSTDSAVDVAPDSQPIVISQADGASGAQQQTDSTVSTSVAGPATGTGAGQELAARTAAAHLQSMQDQVNAALAAKGLSGTVVTKIDGRGLNINVIADDTFFASASAVIQPEGDQVLDAIGPTLAKDDEAISVEGHTNNLPISSSQYADNWDLSSARANAVLRHLISPGSVGAERLQSVGYADTKPMYANDDPRAVEGNRRVDIVVEPNVSAEVKALIPSFVGTAQSSATTSSTAAGGTTP